MINRRRWRPLNIGRVKHDGNPIARGLEMFIAQPGTAGVPPVDQVNLSRTGPAFDTRTGTGSTQAVGPVGPVSVHAGAIAINQITGFTGFGTGESFTFACHVRTHSSISGYLPIMSFGVFSPGLYQSLSGSTWGFYFAANRPAAAALSASTWYTLVAVRDVDTARYYRDGAADGTSSMSGSSGSGNLTVGSNGSTSYFNGSMSWAGVWRRALSQKEAMQLHIDPWSVLRRPRREHVRVPGAAPPAGTPSLYMHMLLGVGS